MLTIPEAVKTLFKTDGVHKNFRASFPNGELADITNGNIMTESLEFTESVSSGDVFRFGLTEASVIKFETVGVGNIKGMTIRCGIEIDTTSLSAAQLTAIAADPGDGVLVLAADSDIGHGYYRVPLGDFVVDSCPRNHEAMAHRKVTAYSAIGGQSFANSPIETAKLASKLNFYPVPNYMPSIPMIVYAALGWYAPALMADTPKTLDCAWADMDYQGPTHYMTETWTAGDVRVTIRMPYKTPVYSDADNLFQLTLGDWDSSAVEDALDWIETTVDGLGADGAAAKAALTGRIGVRVGSFRFDSELPVFYPKFVQPPVSGWNLSGDVQPRIPVSVNITVDNNGTTEGQYSFALYTSDYPTLYKYTTAFDDIRGNFAQTSDGGGFFHTGSSFVGCYDFSALVNGWLELYGCFGRPGRSSEGVIMTLDDSSPVGISAGDIADPGAWWDEYDVSPVGGIRYAYGDGSEAREGILVIGDGGSVYDMTDNYLLQILDTPTAAGVEALITAALVPRLGTVRFTPAELTMRAWLWIEAGDALQITAGDGSVVNTFALTRTVKGVQLLMDSIKSSGGAAYEEGQ